ncbi:MAG: 2-isopropylmalate synthase [Opitutales bacterium]|nr:2-isopropylmalate synthase [Opitutales bacterium]
MQHGKITKYGSFPTIDLPNRVWPNKTIDRSPIWCSVDLRDGNQSLAIPMNIEEKVEMFQMLCEIGFKEIEIGFPSASETEYAFTRTLIERGLIPDDVTIQVLVQCREHLIRRTFEALKGAKKAIVHIYNSTSPLQRRVTFNNASKEQIKQIAIDGARLVMDLLPAAAGTDIRIEYSPESFSDTEVDFAAEVCEAVMEVCGATRERPIILNLPETVQWTTPNVYADMIEKFISLIPNREAAIISLHTHNDRGTGVASTELGLMAGADRVEGTLFGNGERTGNLDIVTVALNMYCHGVDPQLRLDNLPSIREVYERCTRMTVPERQPYAGDLVFTAFSGSHQDAIKKGMDLRRLEGGNAPWHVPYLTIDPADVGANYEAIIRINSQSGKGGIAYILNRDFGFDLPKLMHPSVGEVIGEIADRRGQELSSKEINELFVANFVNLSSPLELRDFQTATAGKGVLLRCRATVMYQGRQLVIEGEGNGPINAFVKAIHSQGWKNFTLRDYRSHAIGTGSASESASYVSISRDSDGKTFWGCGLDTSIDLAGIKAVVSAFNRSRKI